MSFNEYHFTGFEGKEFRNTCLNASLDCMEMNMNMDMEMDILLNQNQSCDGNTRHGSSKDANSSVYIDMLPPNSEMAPHFHSHQRFEQCPIDFPPCSSTNSRNTMGSPSVASSRQTSSYGESAGSSCPQNGRTLSSPSSVASSLSGSGSGSGAVTPVSHSVPSPKERSVDTSPTIHPDETSNFPARVPSLSNQSTYQGPHPSYSSAVSNFGIEYEPKHRESIKRSGLTIYEAFPRDHHSSSTTATTESLPSIMNIFQGITTDATHNHLPSFPYMHQEAVHSQSSNAQNHIFLRNHFDHQAAAGSNMGGVSLMNVAQPHIPPMDNFNESEASPVEDDRSTDGEHTRPTKRGKASQNASKSKTLTRNARNESNESLRQMSRSSSNSTTTEQASATTTTRRKRAREVASVPTNSRNRRTRSPPASRRNARDEDEDDVDADQDVENEEDLDHDEAAARQDEQDAQDAKNGTITAEELKRRRLARKAELARLSRKYKKTRLAELEDEVQKLREELAASRSLPAAPLRMDDLQFMLQSILTTIVPALTVISEQTRIPISGIPQWMPSTQPTSGSSYPGSQSAMNSTLNMGAQNSQFTPFMQGQQQQQQHHYRQAPQSGQYSMPTSQQSSNSFDRYNLPKNEK